MVRSPVFYFGNSIQITQASVRRGIPREHSGKESAGQCTGLKFGPWVREVPWRREWLPTPVFLPGKSHGQRSLASYGPWGRKESDTTEHSHTHTQGKVFHKEEMLNEENLRNH